MVGSAQNNLSIDIAHYNALYVLYFIQKIAFYLKSRGDVKTIYKCLSLVFLY